MLQELYDNCVKSSTIRECKGQMQNPTFYTPNTIDEEQKRIINHLAEIDAEQRIQNSEIDTLKCGNFENIKVSDTLKVDKIESFSTGKVTFVEPVEIEDLSVTNLHIECFCADDSEKFAGQDCDEWKEIINCSCVDDTNKFAGKNCTEWKDIITETYVHKAKDSDCFSGLTCTDWKNIIKTTCVDNAANSTKLDNKTYSEVCEDILSSIPPQPYSGEIDVYCGDTCKCTINCDNPLVLCPNAFNEYATIDTNTYPGAYCTGTLVESDIQDFITMPEVDACGYTTCKGTVTSVNNISPVNGNVCVPLPPDLSSCPGLNCVGTVVESDIADFITMNDVDQCGYTTCVGTVTSVKACLNGTSSSSVTSSGTLSLNITPSLCFDSNSRKICNIFGNKTSNEITLPTGINCTGTLVQSDIDDFITMSEVDACGYTTCKGTVTSVNNITPVNGNVTLALPPDLSSDVTCLRNDVDAIEGKIPTQASTTNQLADKDFVNSSIETATATFVGTFDDVSCLPTTGVDNNDYAFVTTCDSTTGTVSYTRYKYSDYTHTWICEYTINTTGFTAEQLAALNSGITDALVAKITDVYNPTVCIYSNGTCCGSFTLNQSSNKCIGICNDKVAQTLLDTSANRPLLFASASITSGACCGVYYNTNITANPNTGVINATLNGSACRAKCNCVITTTCDCTYYPVFSPNNTSSYKYNYTNANLSYNPGTGTLTALCFNGAAKDSTCFAGCTYDCAKADIRSGLLSDISLNIYCDSTCLCTVNNGENIVLGANAFNSTAFTTCVGTVTSVNVCLNGTNATAITTSGKMCLNLTPSLSYTTSTRSLTATLGNKTSTAITLPEGIDCTGTLVPSDLNGYATEAWVTAKNYCTHDCLVKQCALSTSSASCDRNLLIMGAGFTSGCVCPIYFSETCKLTFNPVNGQLKSGNFVYNKGGCTSRNTAYSSINYTSGTRCTAMDICDFMKCFAACHSLSANENLTVHYSWSDATNNCICWGTSSKLNLSGAVVQVCSNSYCSALFDDTTTAGVWSAYTIKISNINGLEYTFYACKAHTAGCAAIPATICCAVNSVSKAVTATNSTCFNGCTYAQACTNIRTGLVTTTDLASCGYTTCIGTVTGVSLNGSSFTLGTDGVASLTDFKPATAGTADNSTCFGGCTYTQAYNNIRSGLVTTTALNSCGYISSISLNGNAFTVSNGAATLTGFKPDTAVLADCATTIKRRTLKVSAGCPLALLGGITAIDNANIYVSCYCQATFNSCNGVLLSPILCATSYVRTPTINAASASGASKVCNVVIRACCTNAECTVTCTNFTFCGSTGRMHGNVCGNLYGSAYNSCLVCRYTINTGVQHVLLGANCTAYANTCVRVSNGCPLTYDPETGALCACTFRSRNIRANCASGANACCDVFITVCCTDANCVLCQQQFNFDPNGYMYGNVCGNVCGKASNVEISDTCKNDEYTIPLICMTYGPEGKNLFDSCKCHIYFNPSTGTLCTCTICGTVCGNIELAPEHIEYQSGGFLDIYNIGALTVVKAKCALECDLAKCLWKYRETSHIGIYAQYVGVTGTYVRRAVDVRTELVDNLYFSCENGVCCVQLRKINNQIVTFKSNCSSYGEWWIGLSIPTL